MRSVHAMSPERHRGRGDQKNVRMWRNFTLELVLPGQEIQSGCGTAVDEAIRMQYVQVDGWTEWRLDVLRERVEVERRYLRSGRTNSVRQIAQRSRRAVLGDRAISLSLLLGDAAQPQMCRGHLRSQQQGAVQYIPCMSIVARIRRGTERIFSECIPTARPKKLPDRGFPNLRPRSRA